MITPARLDAFLEVMKEQSPEEWSWQRPQGHQYWYVEYQQSYPPFSFFVEFNEEMLYAQYLPHDFRVRAGCWLSLYHVLLRLNEELSLVKFGLTASGNITMMGELPAAQFSLDTFQNLLRLMVQYLENLYWEIGIVAESPELAPYLTSGESFLAKRDQLSRGVVKMLGTENITRV